jgi:hypothetical protein
VGDVKASIRAARGVAPGTWLQRIQANQWKCDKVAKWMKPSRHRYHLTLHKSTLCIAFICFILRCRAAIVVASGHAHPAD